MQKVGRISVWGRVLGKGIELERQPGWLMPESQVCGKKAI
jgi:hypothetical protein